MKTEYPKISVFVLTYNHKAFVHEAIKSILIQEYPNLEIVVGDDASVDGTQEILLEYRDKYPELFKLILSPVNEGISVNCNKILKECTGEYIAILAGDDVWMPGKLLKQIDLMQKNPRASLCVSKIEWFVSDTNKTIRVYPHGDFDTRNMSIIDVAFYIGCTGSSMLVRNNAIPDYGFESSLPMVSDLLFFIEILRKGEVIYINEVLAKYRRHGASMSNYPDIIFKEHMQTLFLLENKHEDMRQDVAKSIKNYVIHRANEILNKPDNFELKRNHLYAILDSTPATILIRYLFRSIIKRLVCKLKQS